MVLFPDRQPRDPDQELAVIRHVLNHLVDSLPLHRWFLAYGTAAPPTAATVTAHPRIVCTLEGRNAMLIPDGGECKEIELRTGEAVVVIANSWNQPLNRHPFAFATLSFGPSQQRYLVRRFKKKGGNRGLSCLHRRMAPLPLSLSYAWRSIENLSEQSCNLASIAAMAEAVVREAHQEINRPPRPIDRSMLEWRTLCALIDEHLHEDITRDSLARNIGVHPNHVSRLFRRHGDESFSAYVIRRRLERAAGLLRSYDLAVSAIAASCGYHSPSYFCNAFRHLYGCSPGRYRELNSAR